MVAVMAHQETYPEPSIGSRKEAIKAALKTHRDLSRIMLSSRETSATGRALPLVSTWLFDVWRLAGELCGIERQIVKRYFLDPDDPGNEQIARELMVSPSHVARVKARAVDRISYAIWGPDDTDEQIGA